MGIQDWPDWRKYGWSEPSKTTSDTGGFLSQVKVPNVPYPTMPSYQTGRERFLQTNERTKKDRRGVPRGGRKTHFVSRERRREVSFGENFERPSRRMGKIRGTRKRACFFGYLYI